MPVLPSPALYFVFIVICAAVLAVMMFRTDRILGYIVIAALAVNFTGAGLMGWWAQRVHGRQYTATDEVAYQWEGQRLLTAWRTGDTSYVRGTVGIYALINAGVIAAAGPGQTPMRITTALVGAVGVSAAFWLALLLYRSVLTARIAALLCATSPLLILFSWVNLRDRWIGTAALLVLIAALLTIERPTWRRGLALIASVWFLAELRHYWGALLGNVAIAGSFLAAPGRWPHRVARAAIVATTVWLALWAVTGTLLGVDFRRETGRKYVTLPNAAPAVTSPRVLAPPPSQPSEPPAGKPHIPDSGPTLGEARAATWPTLPELRNNVSFILFGRVRAHADGGQYAARFLLPEALWSVLLLPLAVAGVVRALRQGQTAVLIPAAHVVGVMALFAWLHGDEWTTYRFRNVYWPVLLIFAAGGLSWSYESKHAAQDDGP
jgi:hypothetical protein